MLLLGGVLLALWTPGPWQHGLTLLLLGTAPLLLCLPRARVGLLLLLGSLHAQHAANSVRAPAIQMADRVLIEARIDSIPAATDSGWQFDAWVSFPRQPAWPAQRARLTLPRVKSAPHAGETWQFAAQFVAAAGPEQARALLRDHVSSMARVTDSSMNRRLRMAPWSLDGLRANVAAHIIARVADPAAAALLAALAVGATGDVTTQQWRVFNATGLTHLVAISGMHVTFFAMLSMGMARLLWRRLPTPSRVRRELFAAAVGIVLALGYALLSGFSVPAQRTVVMLTAFLLVRECARAAGPAWSVAAALTVVLLFDPLAALSAGFWLSFMAVAAIVLIAGARMQPAATLRAALQTQWLVTLALLPATIAIFGSFSAVGMLANALAIPTFTFLLVPPILIATAGYLLPGSSAQWCADQLVDLAAAVASALWPFLTFCAELPAAVWPAMPLASWYLLILPALLLALSPVSRSLRVIALCAVFTVFLPQSPRPAVGELWVDVLDVGASSAVMLRTTHRLLLYGTGEKFGSAGRSFDSRVLPQLRRSGYRALDLWVTSSLGRDVQAALLRGAAQLQLHRIEVRAEPRPPPELNACTPRAWRWDGIEFQVAPQRGPRGCLLYARAGGRWLELAADAGRASVAADTAAPPAAVLLLPRTASAAAQRSAGNHSLLLASLSSSEWESPAWLGLRQRWARDGAVILATAAGGHIRLRMLADGRVRRRSLLQPALGRLQDVAAALFGYDSRPCGNLC
ncbi:MAG: ComEC/Rec2 family competence protein [Steroidobacteraceae bacterium]